jgi:6-pyruvoyltetrahydropterin/6-carboxytetrahydropterin synthase
VRVSLTRRYLFAASHRLYTPQLSESENQRMYGKCSNPYGHGHNYFVEVTVSGSIDPATGMIANLGQLDPYVEARILEAFDQKYLNEQVPEFAPEKSLVPTTENLCYVIFQRLKDFSLAHLERVRIEETSNNSFEIEESTDTAA